MTTAIREDVASTNDDQRAEDARQHGAQDHGENNDDAARGEHDEERERFVSPRDQALRDIAAKNREAVEKELGIQSADDGDDDDVNEADRQMADEPTMLGAADLGKYKVKTKINGVESELSLDEAIRQVQKAGSADQRLEEATRLLNEANAARAAAEARVAAAPGAPAPAATGTPPPSDDLARQYSAALFEGDEEKAAALLDKAMDERVSKALERAGKAGRGDATLSADEVQRVSTTVRQQQVVDDALERVQKDYPLLFSDRTYDAVAGAQIQELVKEGKPFVEALDQVAGEFAAKFSWKPAGRSTSTGTDRNRDRRLERKAGIDSLPAANARRVSSTPQDDVPTDENERAARGIADIIAKRPGQAPMG